jgi:hypothetical protein
MSESKNFGLQHSPRPEQSDQDAPDQSANIAYQKEVSTDSRSPNRSFWVCGRGSPYACLSRVNQRKNITYEIGNPIKIHNLANVFDVMFPHL